jgi:hypothetical protein
MTNFDPNKTLSPDALRSWCELAQARIDVLTERCNGLQSLVGSLQASNARARMEGERIKEGVFEMYRNAGKLYDNERQISPDWLMARCVDLVGFPE